MKKLLIVFALLSLVSCASHMITDQERYTTDTMQPVHESAQEDAGGAYDDGGE